MRYELVSIEDAGNERDDLIRLRRVPSNVFDRLLRRRAEEVVFFGHDDRWFYITGDPVKRRSMRERLTRWWRQNRSRVEPQHAVPERAKPRVEPLQPQRCAEPSSSRQSIRRARASSHKVPVSQAVPNPADRSATIDPVEEALEESFPASDPPSWTPAAL